MARRLTYEEVKNFIEVESGSGCKLISREYIRSNEKLKIKCACGSIFEVTWDSFKNPNVKKRQCNKCGYKTLSKKKEKTNGEFIEEVYRLVGDEYIFLEDYVGSRAKIKCRHNKCNHEWHIEPNSFLTGTRCPKCNGGVKYSYNEVKKYIEVESGSGCKLLDGCYKNNFTKMTFQCKCGNEFITTLQSFKRGRQQCDECSFEIKSKNKTKTNENFLQEVYELVGEEYQFIEKYANSNTKIKCKHMDCGYVYYVTPSNFLSGRRCPNCYGTEKLTYEEVKRFIEEDSKSGCKLLSKEYINNRAKLKLKCKCGNAFKVAFNTFKDMNKMQCNKCSGWKRYTYNDVKQYVEVDSNSGCKLLNEKYKSYRDKLKIQCGCGNIFETDFAEFRQGKHQCNECGMKRAADSRRFLFTEVKRFIEVESESKCKLLSNEYTNCYQDIKILCTCGNTFITNFANFKYSNKRLCDDCSVKSKGENSIKKYLINHNIKYTPQHTYEDCRNKYVLQFDFYLPDYNLLIEYDGIQHFEPIDFFGGQEQFEYQQQNDNIKNQYCKDNNIPLLRIPYWEFDDIEQILDRWLEKHGALQKDKDMA